ncbi:MAG: hypothetical protein WCI79_01495 [Candidatus Saccharibacteria bacterium]
MRGRKLNVGLILSLLGMVVLSSLATIFIASALPGNIDYNEGFFSNKQKINQINEYAVLSSCGNGIPINIATVGRSQLQIKTDFINLIQSYYDRYNSDCISSSYHKETNHVGAEFIIQSMRGDRSRIETGELDDWKELILNTGVTIEKEKYSFKINSARADYSYGVGDAEHTADDYYYNTGSSTQSSLVFYQNKIAVYAIKLNCGNAVGNFKGFGYTLKPKVTAPKDIVTAGVFFDVTPSVQNDTTKKSNGTGWLLEKKVNSGNWQSVSSGSGVIFPANDTKNLTKYTENNTAGLSNGTKLYYRLKINPYSFPTASPAYKYSNEVVVTITKPSVSWLLVPEVKLSKQFAESGEDVIVSMSVQGNDEMGDNKSAWGLFKNGDSSHYLISGNASSNPITRSSGIVPGTKPDTVTGSVGDKVCYTLRVNPASEGSSLVDSTPACLIIVKKPKVQIWGGDLWAGGAITASTSVFGGKTFGSWIEYGIFATQSVDGAASAAAYSGLGFGDTFCKASKLSFTNVNCATSGVDGYSSSHTLSDVAASFPGGITTVSPITAQSLASGTYAVGDVTLKASELPQSRSVIINSSGTVTIIGDQTYQGGSYDSIDKIPQLVIIAAGDINIYADVTQIDAWLVANGGVINTCSDVPISVPLNSIICKNKLVVNGPISAQKLYLRRTFGDGKSSAETFNLRADALVWAANRATVSNGVRTVYSTELPPRF